MLLLTAVLLSALFAAGCQWARRINNYSIVDALWAYGIALTGIIFSLFGNGDLSKRLVAGSLAAFWGIRLGTHLAKRIRKHHPTEDSRYQKLRHLWRGHEFTAFFYFFQAQAFSVLLLALPYYLIARDPTPWSYFETLGLIIALIGIGGEALADHQLSSFIKRSQNPKAVCNTGLWRYSRHPNYFFEMVIWIGIYLFACGSAYGWTTFFAPTLITFLLLKVTGIPPAEASSIKKRGAAYLDYQKSTSVFIPLPPRKS